MYYYACFNSYGMISLDSFGGHAGYLYFAFASKKDRDSWVDDNRRDVRGNVVAAACPRSEVSDPRACGRRFDVVRGVCRPRDWFFTDDGSEFAGAEQMRMFGGLPGDKKMK